MGSNNKKQTVGSFLFQHIHERGVETAFGIPGDFALPTFRWLEKSPLKLINMTHEPSVGFAADAYARVHGLGVAVVTYCVGGLNMLNSIACAYAEKSPVIVISGGPSPKDRDRDSLIHHKVKTFDSQRKIYEEVTCATAVLDNPETAAEEIIRVVDAVLEHCRPGYIEVPFDIVDLPIKIPAQKPKVKPQSDKESLKALIEEAAEKINSAKKPVMMADIELHRHHLTPLALKIAEKFNIPIASTLLSKSIIKENHPLYLGVYSGMLSQPECKAYVESSDCVIMLGAFISDVLYGFVADYPRLERRNSIMVTTQKARVGYRFYEEVLFEDFLKGMINAPVKPKAKFKNPSPMQEPKPLTSAERAKKLDSTNVFRIIALEMEENSAFVCDTGDAVFGAIDIETTRSQNFISDAYYLSMGFAVPASIGVMAASKKGRTFVIVGDGAFQMTGMELSTAIKNKMAPIVILLNNDGYGTQRHIIDGDFNNILRWNYSKLTDVLGGGKSFRVTTCGELEKAIQSALKSKEMHLIEVILPRDACSRALKSVGEGLKKARDRQK